MGNKPLVTIGVSFHNEKAYLPSLLRTVFAQTYENWELVLVDDGSNDGGYGVVSEIRDQRVRLLRSEENLRVPVQLNYISSVANGKYVARMDADDMASPWRLEKQVMFLEENISVDLVSSEYLAIGGGDDVLGAWHGPPSHGDICRRPWTRVELLHGGIMGRREWFLENPYEPRYWGIEDQALLMKASAQSVYASIPEPLYFYRVFDTYTLRKHLRAEFSLMRLAYDSRREGYGLGKIGSTIAGRVARAGVYTFASAVGKRGWVMKRRFDRPTEAETAYFAECHRVIDDTRVPGVG